MPKAQNQLKFHSRKNYHMRIKKDNKNYLLPTFFIPYYGKGSPTFSVPYYGKGSPTFSIPYCGKGSPTFYRFQLWYGITYL